MTSAEKIRILTEALEFYANKDNWVGSGKDRRCRISSDGSWFTTWTQYPVPEPDYDELIGGHRARAALSQVSPTPKDGEGASKMKTPEQSEGTNRMSMQEKRDLGADKYVDQWGDGNDTITQDWMHSAYQAGWNACLTELSSCDLDLGIEQAAIARANDVLGCLRSDREDPGLRACIQQDFIRGASFATQRVMAKMEKEFKPTRDLCNIFKHCISGHADELKEFEEKLSATKDSLSRLKASSDKLADEIDEFGSIHLLDAVKEYRSTLKELGL